MLYIARVFFCFAAHEFCGRWMGIVCLHATVPFLSMIWMAHLLSPHALAIPASVISWAALSLPSGVAQIHALPAVDAYPLSVLLTAYSYPFLSISFPLRLLYLDARPRRFHWRCGDCSGEVVLPRFRVLAKVCSRSRFVMWSRFCGFIL